MANNVLILYVDSVSRVNGLRQLKKTAKFFEKFMSYKGYSNEKYPNENYHSFQFFKYYSFNGHTTINFPFLFYRTNGSVVNKSLITKYYKKMDLLQVQLMIGVILIILENHIILLLKIYMIICYFYVIIIV